MSSKQTTVDALRAADAAWLKAYDEKDAAKAAAFYDEQGSMLVPHSPILKGKEVIGGFIAKSFAMPDYKIKWRPNQADVAESGEFGYTTGVYEISFRDARGKTVSDKGKYLMLWKKQPDGAWKVLFDVSNSDLPPSLPL